MKYFRTCYVNEFGSSSLGKTFRRNFGEKTFKCCPRILFALFFLLAYFFSSVACGVGDPIVGNVEIYVLKFMVAFPVGFHVGTCHLFEIVGIG